MIFSGDLAKFFGGYFQGAPLEFMMEIKNLKQPSPRKTSKKINKINMSIDVISKIHFCTVQPAGVGLPPREQLYPSRASLSSGRTVSLEG